MQRNPIEYEQKGKDEKEADTKVLAYLSDCGLDTSVISVDDIDAKSLAFLSQWANKNTSAEDSRATTLDDTLHEMNELQDLHCGQNAGLSENNSGENQGRPVHFQVALGQEKTSNHDLSSSFDEITSKFRSLSRAHLELEQLNLLSSSLRAMAPGARQTNQTGATTCTSEHNEKEEELDLETLEPWQRALFQKMDKQTKAIEKCQNQIDVLTNIVAINIVTAKDSFSHPSANAPHGTRSIQPPRASNGVPQQLQAQMQPQLQNQPQIPQLLTILDKVYCIPRNIYAYILSTRPIRVLLLLQHEANNFDMGNPNQRFIDIHLMMKLSFICIFFRARIGNNEQRGAARKLNQKRGAGGMPLDFLGEMVTLWRTHSSELLLVASVIVYFIQTGLIVFLYKVMFKENVIAKVWRNEDLEAVNVGEITMDGAGANHINDARNGEHVLDRGRRRGRRDRMPQAANEENPVIVREGENENQGLVGHAQEPLNPPQNQIRRGVANFQPNINIDDTFVGGVLDPPFQLNGDEERVRNAPREEIFLGHMIDGVKDVLYLFGSFFLSFFPMWRPRVRELVREEGNDNVRRGRHEQNDGREAVREDIAAQNGQDDANENAEDASDDETEGPAEDRHDE